MNASVDRRARREERRNGEWEIEFRRHLKRSGVDVE